MIKVAVATTSRADYSIYFSTLRRLQAEPMAELCLIVTGTHLSAAHGMTVNAIRDDGFSVSYEFSCVTEDEDSPLSTATSMSQALEGFAHAFSALRPDVVLVLGDRFEMHGAAAAAVPFRIPVAHIHGGDVTEGAYDDQFRHSVTKLSHLHFPVTKLSAKRIVQMGEDPARVVVCGSPALDDIASIGHMTLAKLGADIGFPLEVPPLLVTYHPTTLSQGDQGEEARMFFDSLDCIEGPVVVTQGNVDTGHKGVTATAKGFVAKSANRVLVSNLGREHYVSLMRHAWAMAGNSSSGILEAPSLCLPVLNVGLRQGGRERANNVIDVPLDRAAIQAGLRQAQDPDFKAGLRAEDSPYVASRPACETIVEKLVNTEFNPDLLAKKWHTLASA
ncbi:MAG: UDP-N-acetylglucosamine 2-epimerase (hydrolyzing) [Chthonomonadaceae bacterium]|nr:UDP-N-acetylglucosamine 2-epimerase (hydrolyzing) [Chthonomonadaceae bacterium]